jgi:uncharacterized protein (DUF486 family)
MNSLPQPTPLKPLSVPKKLVRMVFFAVVILALAEIVIVSTMYIHEPLAWAFLLQAAAMIIGALSGLIIGKRRAKF